MLSDHSKNSNTTILTVSTWCRYEQRGHQIKVKYSEITYGSKPLSPVIMTIHCLVAERTTKAAQLSQLIIMPTLDKLERFSIHSSFCKFLTAGRYFTFTEERSRNIKTYIIHWSHCLPALKRPVVLFPQIKCSMIELGIPSNQLLEQNQLAVPISQIC